MALDIDTFSNVKGGFPFFKAVGHPQAAAKGRALIAGLKGKVAVYDPLGFARPFAALYDLSSADVACVFVQDIERVGESLLGHRAQPVTDLAGTEIATVLVVAVDAAQIMDQIRHLVPDGAVLTGLDGMRLDDAMMTNPRAYLDPINFATNFAFFRDADGHHTRLTTANYWHGYGAGDVRLWLHLIGGDGAALASWEEPLIAAPAGIVIDSRAVRRRFGLRDFVGQLFVHVIGARGHDVVKYALDTYGDSPQVLSCTHDANAWPSDRFAGLPAPCAGEAVVLWVQNSHPCAIPPGSVGLNLMGSDDVAWLDQPVAPFASHALDVATLLPDARWPQQIEVRAGKHFVRPRYEIATAQGRSRIAHVNVERGDLEPDPRIAEIGNLLGKGYILPAPVLPPEYFRTSVLPTPMATSQATLPVAATIFDHDGREVAHHKFGCLERAHDSALELDDLLPGGNGLAGKFGHVELTYDFADGGEADGWLHAIFRYEDRKTGHAAETSFGAHMFNSVLVYRGEPQSYAGRAPGLSTRLFLRLGTGIAEDTFCHLIYPASTPWHAASATTLVLHDNGGEPVAEREVAIPCGGSLLWYAGETFSADEIARAGEGGYVLVRDATCRLFGYHGLVAADGQAFSLDHMFGF